MKRTIVSFLFTAVLLITQSSNVYPQSWTLNQIINAAINNSYELKSLSDNINVGRGLRQQADVPLNPQIGTTIGNVTQEIEFSQEFEYPGKREARIGIADEQLEIEKVKYRLAKVMLQKKIASIFFGILYDQKIIELYEENLNVSRDFLNEVKNKFNKGYTSKLDLIKARIEELRAKRLLNSVLQEEVSNKANLRIMIGADTASNFEIKGNLLEPIFNFSLSIDSLLKIAYKNSPLLLLQKHSESEAKYELNKTILSSKPNFSVGLAGGIEDREKAFALDFQIPLSLWDTKEGAKASALFKLKSSDNQLKNVYKIVEQQVTTSYNEYITNYNNSKLFRDSLLEESKNTVNLAQEAFKKGSLNLLELIDAQRTYIDASLEYYNDENALRKSEIDLQSSLGKIMFGDE